MSVSTFATPLTEPELLALFKQNKADILIDSTGPFTCGEMRQCVDEAKFAGGTNKYPPCIYRGHACALTTTISAPVYLGRDHHRALDKVEFPSVTAWLTAVLQARDAQVEADRLPLAQIKVAAYQYLIEFHGLGGKV